MNIEFAISILTEECKEVVKRQRGGQLLSLGGAREVTRRDSLLHEVSLDVVAELDNVLGSLGELRGVDFGLEALVNSDADGVQEVVSLSKDSGGEASNLILGWGVWPALDDSVLEWNPVGWSSRWIVVTPTLPRQDPGFKVLVVECSVRRSSDIRKQLVNYPWVGVR